MHYSDSGYINGVLSSRVFITAIAGPDAQAISSSNTSLIVSILSAGTFFGALIAGDLADFIGRKWTIIAGCVIYTVGVVIQMFAATALATIVVSLPPKKPQCADKEAHPSLASSSQVGRLVAGFGVGFVSAIIILYMSEIAPRKVRGAIVSGYQFCITIGIMVSVLLQTTSHRQHHTKNLALTFTIRSWHPSSTTSPRTAPTLARTGFPSAFSSHGV